jgi:hypothetical protein
MRGIAIASGEENDHVDAEHDPQRPDPGFDGPEGKPQRQSHQAGRAERGQASRVDLRRLGPGHDDRGPGRSVARRIVMGELVDTDDAAEAVGCRGEAGHHSDDAGPGRGVGSASGQAPSHGDDGQPDGETGQQQARRGDPCSCRVSLAR